MAGTDIAQRDIGLCARYAMPGTEMAHILCLRNCYAVSGTDLAYCATRNRTDAPYRRAMS
eukprot:3510911-Rhodomonas_salina.3